MRDWEFTARPQSTTRFPSPGGKISAAGRQGEKRANSDFFDGKPLISLKTAKEKSLEKLGIPWKSLEKAWKKLGNPWKSLRASRRRSAPFLDPAGAQ
jgi:hypothetical protein